MVSTARTSLTALTILVLWSAAFIPGLWLPLGLTVAVIAAYQWWTDELNAWTLLAGLWLALLFALEVIKP